MKVLLFFLMVGAFILKSSQARLFSSSMNVDTDYSHLLDKFQNVALPYETGKIKPVRLRDGDSAFLKNNLRTKKLTAVTDTSADVWDDADDEGKTRIDFPELIGAGAKIHVNDGIYLLEVIDMYELKGESESNKQGVFAKTTFLCTFDKNGKPISSLVSNFSMANEHGSVNRWSCVINSTNEIIIKEYGNRKEEKYDYSFVATFKITGEGKFVKIRSVRGGK